MNYLKKIEYKIVLKNSFRVIRNCPKNAEQSAEMHGKNVQLFRKNKATIDFEKVNYDLVKLLKFGDCPEVK